jgi:hypothetical protein
LIAGESGGGEPDLDVEIADAPIRSWDQFSYGLNVEQFLSAGRDFRYLLRRGYPRQASLSLVGNRYSLSGAARQILLRGVFDPAAAAWRRLKLRPVQTLTGQPLALDGHNVLITLECSLQGLPVTAADDGFIRDIGQISSRYRLSPITEEALHRVGSFLAAHGVGPVMFWYDAPMSRSGELAALTRTIMQQHQLDGEAQAVPVPEKKLLEFEGVIGSSDTYLIDRAGLVADVAGEIIRLIPEAWIISLTEGEGRRG